MKTIIIFTMMMSVFILTFYGCDKISSNNTAQNTETKISLPSPVVIPVPGAILLGSIGVGIVGWLRRRNGILS